MSLANLIALVSSVNADPTTKPDIDFQETTTPVVIARDATVEKVEAPIHKPGPPGITMPERNSLDAKGFLLTMRNAGCRPNDKGIMVVNAQEVHNDQIKAIHAFIGYDTRRDFGSQEMAARAKAQGDLRGVKYTGPSREEQRAASRGAAGFVAGMPKPQQRIVLDLQARAVSLAESRDSATSDSERAHYQKLLTATNQALKELDF